MNHEEIRTMLSAFVDHELNASDEALVAEHLKTCSDCQRWSKQYLALKHNVRAAGNFELPYAFANSVTRSIYHNEEVNGSWVGIEHYVEKFVMGLAMVVLLVVGLTMFRQPDDTLPIERYVSGLTSDSAASQILTKRSSVTRDDLFVAALTK